MGQEFATWHRILALLPFIFLAWRSLRFTGLPAWHRLSFAYGLSFAWIVLLVTISGRLTHQLDASLLLGSIVALGIGLSLGRGNFRELFQKKDWSGWHLLFGFWLLATTLLIAGIAKHYDFHDQLRTQSHPAVIESILRGNFPPQLQVFPELPLKYHFGGDLVATLIAHCFGLSGVHAIDVVQILGWVFTSLCLYSVARTLGCSRFLSFLALQWVLMGAGWTYLLKPLLDLPLGTGLGNYNWPDSYVIFQRYLNPGVFSWFFQTPYCTGLAVFFTYLTLLHAWFRRPASSLLVLSSLVLGALSLFHLTLFLGALACSIAAILARVASKESKGIEGFFAAGFLGLTAIAVSLLLGGFFTFSPNFTSGLLSFQWKPGYLRNAHDIGSQPITFTQACLWYLCTLGSLVFWSLPLMGVNLWLQRQFYRPILFFLLCFALGSFLTPQFFRYRFSWDIIKWFTMFQISMSLMALATISAARMKQWWIVLLLLLSIFLDALPSYRMLWELNFSTPASHQGSQRSWFGIQVPAKEPWLQYIESKLLERPWEEMVLANPAVSDALSIHTGQAMAQMDYITLAFGVSSRMTGQRKTLIQRLLQNFDLEDLRKSPVRWLVFSCKEMNTKFSEASQATLEKSVLTADLVDLSPPSSMGCWRVYFLPNSVKSAPAPPR
jgi:hypothetical protein